MKITVTVRELFDKDCWMAWCELTGTSDWAVKDGLMGYDEEVQLTEKQAKKLGLIQ